tara:strand:- start:111 stop:350 length:240 start_codon:yes stop_codon:yes gene_type:complete
MAAHYSFDKWQVARLTFRQLNYYLNNVEYVSEWSEKFGKPPQKRIPDHSWVEFAERCGVDVPAQVRETIRRESKPREQT